MLNALYPILRNVIERGLRRYHEYNVGFRAWCPSMSTLRIVLRISVGCSLEINWGDGKSDTIRPTKPQEDPAWKHGHSNLEHKYTADGYYTVSLKLVNGKQFSVEFDHDARGWNINISEPSWVENVVQELLVYMYTR